VSEVLLARATAEYAAVGAGAPERAGLAVAQRIVRNLAGIATTHV
jgi:hypothetical protein